MNTAVSVVVPCYGAKNTVARAVASIAAQTVQPLEVLLVDDGSTDGTAQILDSLRAGNVQVIRLDTNLGPGSARNAGWDVARGELIAFLDADDSWHPRKLEIQTRFMSEHPEYVLSGHRHVIGGEFGPLTEGTPHVNIGGRALLFSNQFVTPSVMLRRELRARFREGQRHMEDHLLWMQLALDGHRVARIELALTSLYKPQFGATGQSADMRAMERAELDNYRALRDAGRIGAALYALLVPWSLAKYARRRALVALRRVSG